VAGDRDLAVGFRGAGKLDANLKTFVPELRATNMLPGCGPDAAGTPRRH
jgi:hypothetical protein